MPDYTAAAMGSFRYRGEHTLTYEVYGEGDRVLVLVHGLLMNRRMYERLGPAMAARGNRVICLDLLGHGRSDRPDDPRLYSMTAFADQVLALLDHMELDRAVVGGTSLGIECRARVRRLAPGAGRGRCSSRCPCSRTR